jgi:hypothetical protein
MILRDDIKVKYHIEAHRLTLYYPDADDVLFDMLCIANGKKLKSGNPTKAKISSEDIKKSLSGVEIDMQKYKGHIQSLLGEGYIEQSEEGIIFITDKTILKFYKTNA